MTSIFFMRREISWKVIRLMNSAMMLDIPLLNFLKILLNRLSMLVKAVSKRKTIDNFTKTCYSFK